MLFRSFALSCALSTIAAASLSESSLQKHVDSLTLDHSFKPVKEAYWTSLPHHRRTPFAVSPDGQSAYLAYLDSSETDVHVQQVDPSTFAAVGSAVTVTGGKEAGGLVAHNDGFAFLTNEALPSGTADAPAASTPVPVLYRFTSGQQTWKTFLGGPGVDANFGLAASPDLNGDLVYSEEAGMYGAYFVITAYTGDASGHYGDSIKYVKTDGTLTTISGASSSWGCSHNTGIAFEAADAAPFASICAEDQGDIWLNTATQGMSGVKISNENTTNGASGEAMGGMSGSYSGLARLIGSDSYVFAWVSRGAVDLTENSWMGDGYTQCSNRTNGRNVAIAQFTDKNTLVGEQASSVVGAADGDSQINWITQGTADCSNAHVAAFDGSSVLVTWEEIENPFCPVIAMGCQGTFTGTRFQLVTNGAKVGDALVETDTYVAGDMVTMSDGRICWPYVSMVWDLSSPVAYGGSTATTTSMSFACMSLSGSSETSAPSSSVVIASSTVAQEEAATSTLATSTFVTSIRSSTTAAAETTTPVVEATSEVSSSTLIPSETQIDNTSVKPSDIVVPSAIAAPVTTPSGAPTAVIPSQSFVSSGPISSGLPSFNGGKGSGFGKGFGNGRKSSCGRQKRPN
ncbi:hypothetical protein JX265_004894 [Neoarthrinium moseri]|uniref:Uncharacterized protein n=1 Tax=Neoarthrinium moseri TaxID=1658444 RepID=A0A9P9WQ89_9PEZI|nr:hypothetical protein JX265_004894 [Neoarthrinium moseri]